MLAPSWASSWGAGRTLGGEYTLEPVQTIRISTWGSTPDISPLADIDGDGFQDFFAGVSLYSGLGDGTFSERKVFDLPARVTDVGDVDEDGDLDIVMVSPWYTAPVMGPAEPMELQVRRSDPSLDGTPMFRKIAGWPADIDSAEPTLDIVRVGKDGRLRDLDGDGHLDLVALGGELQPWTDEDGTWPYWRPYYLVARGDGAGGFSQFSPFLTTPEAPPGLAEGRIETFEVVDLNADGRADLVGVGQHDLGLVFVSLNGGDATFPAPARYSAVPPAEVPPPHGPGGTTSSVFPADVDGDGDIDLAIGFTDAWTHGPPYFAYFSILRNRGGGSYEDAQFVLLRRTPGLCCSYVRQVAVGDYNGDGALDAIVTTTLPTQAIHIASCTDPTRLAETVVFDRGIHLEVANRMRAGDFDGDGLVDAIVNGDDCERTARPCNLVVLHGKLSSAFLRGDANIDEVVDLADAISILGHLFGGEPLPGTPPCADRADADDSGRVEITDAVFLLNYLFRGGPSVPPPFPAKGPDPTADVEFCG